MSNPSDPNNDQASVLQEVAELVPLAVEGLASDEQFARLNTLLNTHPEARQYYLQYLDLHVELVSLSESNVLDGSDGEPYWYERDAFAPLTGQDASQEDAYSFAKALSLLGYAGAQTARRHAVALVGVAALLVIAVVLGFVLIGDNEDSSQLVAADNPQNDTATPMALPIVATLTAEHDAVWDRRPGDDLYAGQRFTLTQGFAEITTGQGAVAILEAPTTIELFDNDNALQLFSGKLVGICETDSSKGFVVRTAQASITDLGTRFGVAVDRTGNLFAEVFTGSIAVRTVAGDSSSPNTEILQAGASIALDRQAKPIADTKPALSSFDGLAEPAMGVLRVSGQVVATHSMPNSLKPDDLAPSTRAYLIEEPIEPALKADLELSIASPGEYVDFIDQPSTATLPAGEAIRSYALVIRPESNAVNSLFQGSITFDGEIIGVLADVKSWQRFDLATDGLSMKTPPGVKQLLEGVSSGIDLGSTDKIKLHDDRRTLSFFANTNQHFDAIRILVKPKSTAE